jgi:hypothetical protein
MKKNIILFSLMGICLATNAQQKNDGFTIKGYVEGLSTPYLYTLGLPKRDSIAVKDGYFSYTGIALKAPVQISISDKKNFRVVFYAENTTIDIKGKSTAPEEVLITGGQAQQDFNALNAVQNCRTKALVSFAKRIQQLIKLKTTSY